MKILKLSKHNNNYILSSYVNDKVTHLQSNSYYELLIYFRDLFIKSIPDNIIKDIHYYISLKEIKAFDTNINSKHKYNFELNSVKNNVLQFCKERLNLSALEFKLLNDLFEAIDDYV